MRQPDSSYKNIDIRDINDLNAIYLSKIDSTNTYKYNSGN